MVFNPPDCLRTLLKQGMPHYRFAGILLFCMLCRAYGASAQAPPNPAPLRKASTQLRTLYIAVTGDVKGWLWRPAVHPHRRAGGFALLTPHLMRLRKAHPQLILLDGGDFLADAPETQWAQHQGRLPLAIPMMEALGYDAAVLGNRDLAHLRLFPHWKLQAGVPWLAANVHAQIQPDAPFTLPFASFVLLKRGGLRIAIVGMTQPGGRYAVPKHQTQWVAKSLLPVGAQLAKKARTEHRADLVIGVVHSGVNPHYGRQSSHLQGKDPPAMAGLLAWPEGTKPHTGFDILVSSSAHRLHPLAYQGWVRPRPNYTTPLIETGAYASHLLLLRVHMGAFSAASSKQGHAKNSIANISQVETAPAWRVMRVEAKAISLKPDPNTPILGYVPKALQGPLQQMWRWLNMPTPWKIKRRPTKRTFWTCLGALRHRAALHIINQQHFAQPIHAPTIKTLTLLPIPYWLPRAFPKTERGHAVTRKHLYRWFPYPLTLVQRSMRVAQLRFLTRNYANLLHNTRRMSLQKASVILSGPGFWEPIAKDVHSHGNAFWTKLSQNVAAGPHATLLVWTSANLWNSVHGLGERAWLPAPKPAQFAPGELREALFTTLKHASALPMACHTWFKR